MSAEYLASPDEAEQAADYYMMHFAQQGAVIGRPITLVVKVSKIKPKRLATVENTVRMFYNCAQLESKASGFFKKLVLRAVLSPLAFDRDNVLIAAKSLYRLILQEDVAVAIEMA